MATRQKINPFAVGDHVLLSRTIIGARYVPVGTHGEVTRIITHKRIPDVICVQFGRYNDRKPIKVFPREITLFSPQLTQE